MFIGLITSIGAILTLATVVLTNSSRFDSGGSSLAESSTTSWLQNTSACIPLCSWLVLAADGQVVYPRGPQVNFNPKWTEQAHTEYRRACDEPVFEDEEKKVSALTNGGLLGALVGGDWGHDNDLDVVEMSPNKVCACFYGAQHALCPKNGKSFVDQRFGKMYWMKLPGAKHVGGNLKPRGNDNYVSFHGTMFLNKHQT